MLEPSGVQHRLIPVVEPVVPVVEPSFRWSSPSRPAFRWSSPSRPSFRWWRPVSHLTTATSCIGSAAADRVVPMALEHALLVSLSERPASGLDLTRRFDRSIGFFWSATHQQIYRVLARMEAAGWVSREDVAQSGRPDKKVYAVAAGRPRRAAPLARRARPGRGVPQRARGEAPRRVVRRPASRARPGRRPPGRPPHPAGALRGSSPPATSRTAAAGLSPQRLDVYLVLRGGIRLEQFWVDWLAEYLRGPRSDPDGRA